MTANWKKRIDELWLHIGAAKFYTAENDAAFKKLFVDNPELLKQFISDILHIPVEEMKDFQILNPEFPPKEPIGKGCRLDISIMVGDKKINIEMQAVREEDFGDRTLYYWAELHISGVERGAEYGKMPKTIAVNILGFRYFDWEKYHSCFTVRENDEHYKLSDKLEIHFFELPKLEKVKTGKKDEQKRKKMSNEELWLRMLSAKRKEDFEMIASAENISVNESIVKLLKMNTNREFREYMRERDKWERDYLASMTKARREGKEEGFDEGKAEGLEEGKKKGIAIGRAEGLEEGEKKGAAKAKKEFADKLRREGASEDMIARLLADDDD